MDFQKIEKKWKPLLEKTYNANISKKKKFFSSIVIPYVNGDMHIGHSYTYIRTDAYARLKRMQGYNVLLAQGFHATGEPIVGAVERLRKGDKAQESTFRLYGLGEKEISSFKKKGPEFVARFWADRMKKTAKAAGLSVDWRRSFITAIDPSFNRFIEWQYNTLRKKGYVVQGTHPVIWCPHDKSPTGDHDRLEGEGEGPVDFIAIKFKINDSFLLAATLRPETIYGVVNIWLNPNATYVKAKVDGETWIISEQAAAKLGDQLKSVENIEKVDISKLIGKRCSDPISNRKIPILPSNFVDPENATGVVMSVPSHAPYDWIALQEIINNGLDRYGIEKNELEPITLIETEGLGSNPAGEICKKMNITSLQQRELLDEATKIIYKKEFHQGALNANCGQYAGITVTECKDKLSKEFVACGLASVFWETTDKVVCRCTTKCHVKILENQWFLKYSDEKWKNAVRKSMSKLVIYPEEARQNFLNTIDWLNDKACARKSGLGTRLPWDNEWIVETLSDSTVYMAYYTIAHIASTMKPADLTDEVFDYIFLGKKKPKSAGKKTDLMKAEFSYFYPVDFRNSGKDLIQNHLTFFLFQHAALFPESKWPRCIGVNGYVNVEGEKMSKSKGNIIPLTDLISQFGSDMVRLNIASSAEGINDADWRFENIKSFRSRYEFLFDAAKSVKKSGRTKEDAIDAYINYKINKNVSISMQSMEETKFRTAVQHALFDSINDLKWYTKRCQGKGINPKTLSSCLRKIAYALCPLTPHLSEELWKMSGGKGIAGLQQLNIEFSADTGIEMKEAFIKQVIEDVERVKTLVNIDVKKVTIFIAEKWKHDVFSVILQNKGRNTSEITREIMSSGKYGKSTLGFIQSLCKKTHELQPAIQKKEQSETLEDAKLFIEAETGCKIEIIHAEDSDNPKAQTSMPSKPGILLE